MGFERGEEINRVEWLQAKCMSRLSCPGDLGWSGYKSIEVSCYWCDQCRRARTKMSAESE